MAHVSADRTLDTSTTTGTGAYTVSGTPVTGYRALSAVLSVGDTFYGFVEAVDANGLPTGDWETGFYTYSGANTVTRTTVRASTNANAAVSWAAGTKRVSISLLANAVFEAQPDNTALMPAVGTVTAPSAGYLKWYAKSRAGHIFPTVMDASGKSFSLQTAMFGNRVALIRPGSSTAISSLGLTPTTAATLSHPTLATTNLATSLTRTRFQTSTTAGNASGVRDGVATHWLGNGAGKGGFFAHFYFCSGSIAIATQQRMVGLSSSVSALAGEPSSSMADFIGMCKDGADTNWFISRRTGTGAATKVDLGVAVATDQVFHMTLHAEANGSAIFVKINRYNNDGTETNLLDTSYNTSIPTSTTFLARHLQTRNNAAASACNMEMCAIYSESDL